jgi:capsid protein
MNPISRAIVRMLQPAPIRRSFHRRSHVSGSAGIIGQATAMFGSYFDGLRPSDNRTPLPVSPVQLRWYLNSLEREYLAAIAQYLYDNVGIVSYAIETIVNYAVPVKPLGGSDDEEWNDLAEAVFDAWCPVADFTGRFDFAALQKIIARTIPIVGDIGALAVDEVGFPQIQLIDSWMIKDHEGNSQNGVILDAKGRVTGYAIQDGDSVAVKSANEFILLFDPERASSYRGITPLRRGMNDIRDIGDLKSLEKLAQKVRASVPAVLETEVGIEENVWGDDVANAPGPDATPQERKMSFAELLGGDIPALAPGEKLTPLTGDRSAQPATDFITALTGYFVYGLGIPPAFFLDEKLTGPNTRSVNGKAQRAFDNHRRIAERFSLWCWRRVIGAAIARGELPSNPKWDTVTYQIPAKISIDTGEEDRADMDGVLNGTRTRQEVWGRRGKPWDDGTKQVFREQRAIIEQAKILAADTGVALDVILAAHGFEPPAGAVKPTPLPPNQSGSR